MRRLQRALAEALDALPAIADEFSADAGALGWLTTVFFLSAAGFLVPLGRIADMHGAKKVFLTGIGVYLLSSVLCIIAPSLPFLTAAWFITGIGGGMIFSTSIALLSLAFPESERGRALGMNVTGMFLGFLLGFFLGGLLTYWLVAARGMSPFAAHLNSSNTSVSRGP